MTLPIDRTALTAASTNQVPNALIRSALNIAALTTPYDTIDELNAKTNLIQAQLINAIGQSSISEVVEARTSEPKAETFVTLKQRLDAVEEDTISLQAETTTLQAETTTLQAEKANQADLTTTNLIVANKRDKTTKIIGQDLDTSTDATKVQLINLSEEVQAAMAGTAPVIGSVADGSITSTKYADESITKDKLNFRFMTGIVKQGTINVNTSTNKLECNAGGVFVDNMAGYILYSTHQIDFVIGGEITAIYFNVSSSLFENYSFLDIPVNPDLAFIATYWSGLFNGPQDYDALLVDGKTVNTIKYNGISTPHIYAVVVNGSITIDTTAETIAFNEGYNLIFGGRQVVLGVSTVDYSVLATTEAVNIYWDDVANSWVCYKYNDIAQQNKRLALFGTLFDGKMHNCLSNNFITVDGVAEGGWYVAPSSDTTKDRITTLNEAWNNWEKGSKYPIAFLGDSTTDGNTTSDTTRNVVGTDYINTYAYPYLLEQLIKGETNNTVARVYNAGFSGQTALWAKNNADSIFGSGTPYADVKMVGISYGINDSLTDDISAFYTGFKTNVEWLINYFKGKSIQPFLVTTQATLMKKGSNLQSQTNKINTVANQVKFELANKYNLEIFDNNKYTEMFLMHSKNDLNSIESDTLHFGDIGHQYEGDYYFSEICPRAMRSSEHNVISMLNQNIKTDLLDAQITKSTSSVYKFIVDYTRAETTDIKVLDCLLFNDEKVQLKLNVVGNVVVKINGDVIADVINYELDLGMHHIEIISNQTQVNFEGISLVRS